MRFLWHSLLVSFSVLIATACGVKVTQIDNDESQSSIETKPQNSIHKYPPLLMQYAVKQMDKANGTSKVNWQIKNTGNTKFPATGWTLYFNQIAATVNEASLPNTFTIKNVKGDFHKLEPTENFKGLAPGDSITIQYQQNYPILRKSFLPNAPYSVDKTGKIHTNVQFEYEPFDETIYKDYNIPNVQSRYEANKNLSLLNIDNLIPIIPTPASYQKYKNEILLNDSLLIVYDENFKTEAQLLKSELSSHVFMGKIKVLANVERDTKALVKLTQIKRETNEPEAYEIKVKEQIELLAENPKGMFYAIQSLLQIIKAKNIELPSNKIKINALSIVDSPKFDYRGLMIDVSRNFHRKATVLEIIDQMAYFKLNKLHLHLTDDEGWRIEIEGLPELTKIGAKRGHTIDESENLYPFYSSGLAVENSYGTGYFSKADFIEILQYANKRHIEVIPEIDLPGHIRAGIVSMRARYNHFKKLGDMERAEEYLLEDFEDESVYESAQGYNDNAMCVCRESAFTFIEKVVDELAEMYKQAEVPFKVFHSGGDEVAYGAWQKSPICQKFVAENDDLDSTDDLHAYTLKRLKKILEKHKVTSAGWEEIVLKHTKAGHQGIEIDTAFVTENVRPYVWNAVWGWGREDMTYKLANLGFQVVMCNSAQLYLDMAYNTHPNEIGLSWSGFTNTKSPYDLVPYNIYKTAKVNNYNDFIKEKVQLTEQGKQNLLGIQGQVWSETLTNKTNLHYMLYPKMLALSERAWSSTKNWDDASHKDIFKVQQPYWNEFANRLGQVHLPQLDELGMQYRIPLPGALIENDTLYANVTFPGLRIAYTLDDNENELDYNQPVFVKGKVVKLKAYTTKGRQSRVSILYK